MRTHPRQPAFSLLELLVVIAILAIFAHMAVPRYSRATTRYRADAAARRVAADLELARKYASHASASQTVTFDVAADSYRLPGFPDPSRPTEEYEVRLAEEPYRATIVSVNFGGGSEVVFGGYGLPIEDAAAGGTMVIQVGKETRTVKLDPDTGEASAQ